MTPQESIARAAAFESESEVFYSLEVIAELAGVSTQTVLHYHELGVISKATPSFEYDDDGLRQIRRMEHLKNAHELTDGALKLIAELLNELEKLRAEMRQTKAI